MKPDYDRAANALEFVARRAGIVLEITPVSIRPNSGQWGKNAYHYVFRLLWDQCAQFEGHYSLGVGHGIPPRWWKRGQSTNSVSYRDGLRPPKTPTVGAILASIALDASCYDSTGSPEEFATEFGYTENDSASEIRAGFAAFEGCRNASEALASLPDRDLSAIQALSGML